MHMVFAFFVALTLAMFVYYAFQRIPRLPEVSRGWGSTRDDDPRIAAAAMMYAVATENGPLGPEDERHILALLQSRIGLEADVARTCLTGGRRVARRLRGDLNSRLHQLAAPIEIKCSPQEKQDVIDMLKAIAGPNAERLGPVRDGLSRISSSLLC